MFTKDILIKNTIQKYSIFIKNILNKDTIHSNIVLPMIFKKMAKYRYTWVFTKEVFKKDTIHGYRV